jgi:hypothetical protein
MERELAEWAPAWISPLFWGLKFGMGGLPGPDCVQRAGLHGRSSFLHPVFHLALLEFHLPLPLALCNWGHHI